VCFCTHCRTLNSHFLARADEASAREQTRRVEFLESQVRSPGCRNFQCQREIQTSLRLVTHLSSITLAQCEPMLCISTSTPSFKSLSGSCITRFISRCCRARVLWPHNMLVIQAIWRRIFCNKCRATPENSVFY
jgi:hypothetical protein